MRLISIDDVSQAADYTVFRTSPLHDLIASSIFFLLLAACTVFYVWLLLYESVSAWGHLVYLWFAFWFGLLFLLSHARYRACGLPSNWLVRLGQEHILVKFRSFQNHLYPDSDRVVAELPWREIDWVRKVKETSHKDHGDSKVTEFFTYIDLRLNISQQELDLLAAALSEERLRPPPRSTLNELRHELFHARKQKLPAHELQAIKDRIKHEKMSRHIKQKSGVKHHDVPVRLVHDNILRLRWNGISPAIKPALKLFCHHTKLETEIKLVTDTSKDRLSEQETEDMIIERVSRGDYMDAIELVRKQYGYSLEEAKRFVNDLGG